MDAVTEEARKLDEEDEEDIIALCCVLIVLIVVGLAHASRENIGRLGRIEGTAARYGSTPGGISRVGQIDPVPASGCWIGSVRSGGKRSSA